MLLLSWPFPAAASDHLIAKGHKAKQWINFRRHRDALSELCLFCARAVICGCTWFYAASPELYSSRTTATTVDGRTPLCWKLHALIQLWFLHVCELFLPPEFGLFSNVTKSLPIRSVTITGYSSGEKEAASLLSNKIPTSQTRWSVTVSTHACRVLSRNHRLVCGLWLKKKWVS